MGHGPIMYSTSGGKLSLNNSNGVMFPAPFLDKWGMLIFAKAVIRALVGRAFFGRGALGAFLRGSGCSFFHGIET